MSDRCLPLQAISYHPGSPANYPERAPPPAFTPAARQAERWAGSGSSWHSRSWSNTHCHRAGPSGSRRSWPAPAGRCTPCPGPWTEGLVLWSKRRRRGEAALLLRLSPGPHTLDQPEGTTASTPAGFHPCWFTRGYLWPPPSAQPFPDPH